MTNENKSNKGAESHRRFNIVNKAKANLERTSKLLADAKGAKDELSKMKAKTDGLKEIVGSRIEAELGMTIEEIRNHKYFGVLYREGPECASNTRYYFFVDQNPTSEEQRIGRLDFVDRYNDLSADKTGRISEAVRPYKGPQEELIKKIEGIVKSE